MTYARRTSMILATLSLAFGSAGLGCSGDGEGARDGGARTPEAGAGAGKDVDLDGGPPFLVELSVISTGDSASGIALVPPFSSDVHDYYVRCAAGSNTLTVSMTASPGAESSLRQPETSASRPAQTLSLNVKENQAIVATATAGTAATDYWVRCLPHDFPKMQMSVHSEAGTAPPGYYLLGNRQLLADTAPYAMILDIHGVPVWYVLGRMGAGVINVDSLVNEQISFIGSTPANNPYEIHALSPFVTSYVAANATVLDDHELRLLSNGDFLALSNPIKTGVDLGGLKVPLPDGGVHAFGASSDILDCNVVEFDKAGNVVWTWVGSDHFDPATESTFPDIAGNAAPADMVVDVFHCNSIDVDLAHDGDLLVSSRHMDSVFYIDRSSGALLWKLGGTPNTRDNPIHVPVADPFFRQHDARLQGWSQTGRGGTGQVSMFDDETSKPGKARGVVYDVIVTDKDGGADMDAGVAGDAGSRGEGGATGDGGIGDGGVGALSTATVSWQYKGATNATATGSFRISDDGSRVICWGLGATRYLVFTEVDVGGDDLVDFYYTDDNSSYRVVKTALTAFDLGLMRNTAGQ